MPMNPAAKIIPDLLEGDDNVGPVSIVKKDLPMTPWSDGKFVQRLQVIVSVSLS